MLGFGGIPKGKDKAKFWYNYIKLSFPLNELEKENHYIRDDIKDIL